jgi:hypothetical protein
MDSIIMPAQVPSNIARPQALRDAPVTEEKVDDLAHEAAHAHPAVIALQKSIDIISGADEWVGGALSLSRDERLDVMKKVNVFDIKTKEEAIHQELHSNSFRIWAGTVLTGAASALGTLVAIAAGVVVPAPLALLLPATLVLGVGISRLYKAGAEKWIAPGRLDRYAVEVLQSKQQSLHKEKEKVKKELEATLDKVAKDNTEFAQAGLNLQPNSSDIVVDEEVFEIDGVKIPINRHSGLLQGMLRFVYA